MPDLAGDSSDLVRRVNLAVDWVGGLRSRAEGEEDLEETEAEIAASDQDGSVMIEAWSDRRRVLYCPVNREEF